MWGGAVTEVGKVVDSKEEGVGNSDRGGCMGEEGAQVKSSEGPHV